MKMDRPRVVGPRHVAERLIEQAVVRRVDQPLVRPGAERVDARRSDCDLQFVGKRDRAQSPLHQLACR